MEVALILLAALIVVGVALYLHHRYSSSNHPEEADVSAADDADPSADDTEQCCGQHLVCERFNPPLADEPVYYDDYELDAYRGRSADAYSDDETEQFRDVLLTLLPADVQGWAQSLQLRGIEPPHAVRDELLLMLSEIRQKH